MNNLSSRLIVNDWLKRVGQPLIPSSATYQQAASYVRTKFGAKQIQAPFACREDAATYLRYVASQVRHSDQQEPLDGIDWRTY